MAGATQSGKVGLGVGVVVRDGVSEGVRVTVGFWGKASGRLVRVTGRDKRGCHDEG